jgi:hypothetical protein
LAATIGSTFTGRHAAGVIGAVIRTGRGKTSAGRIIATIGTGKQSILAVLVLGANSRSSLRKRNRRTQRKKQPNRQRGRENKYDFIIYIFHFRLMGVFGRLYPSTIFIN